MPHGLWLERAAVGGSGERGGASLQKISVPPHAAASCYLLRHLRSQEWVEALLPFLPKATVAEESEEVIRVTMPADTDNNVFPLKARDAAIDAGFKLLKAKGLVPDNADDSDDDVNYAEAAGVEW